MLPGIAPSRGTGRVKRRRLTKEASRARRSVREKLIAQLEEDGKRIAACFGLRYRGIEAERDSVKGHYGTCSEDGVIRIRLLHATTRSPLRYSSLVNTLCHELTHLRYFDHGDRFKAFYFHLLEWARAERIYRPASRAEEAGSRQMTLFLESRCRDETP